MKKAFIFLCLMAFFTHQTQGQTQYNASSYHQFNTNYGYMQIGAQNSGWVHMYTDRPAVIFNKPVYSYTGEFSAYSTNNLLLQTNGSTRMKIEASTGRIYIPFSSNLTIGDSWAEGNPRLWFHHNGTHGYIDYKDNLHFRADKNWISALTLYGNGSVGVGFTTTYSSGQYKNQGYKLAVNGGILCEEVKVITDVPDADYVFEEDYKLLTLPELELFVKKNKHLPDIPSALEFKTNGYKVGEMDEMLLRKVEEMTLLMIEMNKRLETLEKENKELKSKLIK